MSGCLYGTNLYKALNLLIWLSQVSGLSQVSVKVSAYNELILMTPINAPFP